MTLTELSSPPAARRAPSAAVGERADGLGEAHDVGFKLAGDAPGEELDEVVVGARGEGLAVRGHREDVHGVLMVVREALLHVRGLGVAHVHRPVRTARHQASLVAGADEAHVAGARDVAEVPLRRRHRGSLMRSTKQTCDGRVRPRGRSGRCRRWSSCRSPIRSHASFLKV